MTNTPLFRLFSIPLALLLLLVAGMAACSSERKSVVGRTYRNIVARDNGFFLAREKMRTTEATLYAARINDYNRFLPLFPTLDDATVTKITADLDDIIKKASLPLQYQPGSAWTDDSYLVIGKARYYKKEYEEAAKTFRYINGSSEDATVKQEALIWLMRTYLAQKEYDNAAAVSDVLDKEEGRESTARELFLTRAEYHLLTDNPKLAIENLNKAIPYIKPKNERSRTRYILAQLYQAQGQDKEAYAELNQILKRNPPYELDFYSKLLLGQVSDLNTDRARLDKYFAKLLKDPNNKEYRDKVLYEMARLDYRQQRYPEALALVQQSLRVPTPNRAQKSYTHLLAGRIYYENLQRYQLAAAYYDSAVQNLPPTAPEYAATAERAQILQEFAKQITIIETQDSLQALARLDTAALRTRLSEYAKVEIASRQQQAERLAAAEKAQEVRQQQAQAYTGVSETRAGNPDIDPMAFANTSTGAQWYFDNPAALSTARSEFIRRWGTRQLQDNWRVSSQVSGTLTTNQSGSGPATNSGVAGAGVNSATGAAPAANDAAAFERGLVAQYRQNIPLTVPQLQASQKQMEEALFALGGIYNQQLREPTRAVETYDKLIAGYPNSTHLPEVYYSLYLIYKDQNDPKAEVYSQRLRQSFPNSSYARLVGDPEYLRRTSLANAQVGVLVDSAFVLYKKQDFKKAAGLLDQVKRQYPDNALNDRVAFLNTLLTIRTQPPLSAQAAVQKFYKDYPSSPLAPQAAILLKSYQDYKAGSISGALASTEKPPVSAFRPGEIDTRRRVAIAPDNRPVVPVNRVAAPPVSAPIPASKANPTPAKQSATTVAKPAEASSTAKPTAPAPVPTNEKVATQPTTPAPATAPGGNSTPAPAEPAATPYLNNPATGHAVVLIFPKGAAPVATLPAALATYNNRFYRANNLQVQPTALGDSVELVVVQTLPVQKAAQSYALKLRGPQSPLSRLRGAGYQILVIGIDNLPLLLQTKDLADYQRFYEREIKN
ncbi:tetratricopeptide repeat protein [Hymenobacter sp. BT188]|uniref:type IX secretion system periplasmic lipoprotein PorW/SprE n=1 Tax=Hymenobacter sp. BT188 TaxID=2763504 RepID=UPI0016512772|nr:tetratricopeptide repeat protein [Hymenobacter sp. BT188]MBC6608607.1 tetratricopeptide repeat protein [Hymenobacter sp. BT188]